MGRKLNLTVAILFGYLLGVVLFFGAERVVFLSSNAAIQTYCAPADQVDIRHEAVLTLQGYGEFETEGALRNTRCFSRYKSQETKDVISHLLILATFLFPFIYFLWLTHRKA